MTVSGGFACGGYAWLRYVQELRRPPGVLLDIGCSMGYYLDAAQRLGWTAYGTDVSRHALKETQRGGIRRSGDAPAGLSGLAAGAGCGDGGAGH